MWSVIDLDDLFCTITKRTRWTYMYISYRPKLKSQPICTTIVLALFIGIWDYKYANRSDHLLQCIFCLMENVGACRKGGNRNTHL